MSLFDDPRRIPRDPPAVPPTEAWRERRNEAWPEPAPRATSGRPAPQRRRASLAPAAIGLFVTLAVLGGIAVGHEAWSPGSALRTTDQGRLGLPTGSSSPGSGRGGYVPGYGYYGGGGGGVAAGGGAVGTGGGGSSSSGSSSAGAASTQGAATAAQVNPALVFINSTFAYQGAEGAGTGIVLTADGEILTNNHVVNGASSISVTDVGNGKTYTGTVTGYDRTRDIAVVQLRDASGLQTAKLGASTPVAVGQSVIAIGNAGGGGGTPVSAPGSVTGLNRSITAADEIAGTSEQLSGLIEVDAAVEAGDSGGPLVNTAGEVIGVDTAASAGFSFRSGGNQGFAVPIDDALAIVKQIESGQSTADVHVGPTAFLGVLIASSNGGQPGAHISEVAHGGAAARAGLVGGDLITSLDGQTIDSPAALSKLIISLTPGQQVTIHWTDAAGQTHSGTVNLGTGPPA